MAVMQGPQQAVPPQAPPAGKPPMEGPKKVYPADKEQAQQFILNLVKVIHGESNIAESIAQSEGTEAPLGARIGAIAAKVLVLLFTQAFKQTNGAQVVASFAVEAIRRAVTEIAEIAGAVRGQEVSKKEVQQAAKLAGDSLQQTMQNLMKGGGQPEGSPQGPPQGVMQGPPPQGQPQAPPQAPPQGGM